MLRSAKQPLRATKQKKQQVQKKKTTIQTRRRLQTKVKGRLPNLLTNPKANMSTQTKPNHESGFDNVISKLKDALNSDQIDPMEILKEQNKAISTFQTRVWEPRDTLTVLPHLLELMQPDNVFCKLAVHRVANLRSQLRAKELERIKADAETAMHAETYNEDEIQRKIWLHENTIDFIPTQDIVRLQMQIVLSSLQYVHLSYQNYCKNTFGFDPQGLELLSTILNDLENVPQLTFYRMHYQQALLNMTSLLTNHSDDDLLEILSSINNDSMQAVFLKRFAFSRSQAFKEALRKSFKEHDVLSDTTMLPLTDPVNITKHQIISEIMQQSAVPISSQSGIKGGALGHLLLETELSMGVRFPKEPKDILHVKSIHAMAKIAKMPQNPQIVTKYTNIINAIELPSERKKTLLESVPIEDHTSRDKLIYEEKVDSSNFIASMEELPVHFPEDLWSVPVSRAERADFFNRFPASQVLWSLYNKMINTADSLQRDVDLQERYNEEIQILEKSFSDNMTDAEKGSIDKKIQERRDALPKLTQRTKENAKLLQALDEEYQKQSAPWREQIAQIQAQDEAEEEQIDHNLKPGVYTHEHSETEDDKKKQ